MLLLSETVTNAIRHAPGSLHIRLQLVGQRLLAAVDDESPWPPRQRKPDESGGRGMELLQRLSKRWGVQQHPGDGKTVWFELHDD
jgi:two-component sensor histidine kinase